MKFCSIFFIFEDEELGIVKISSTRFVAALTLLIVFPAQAQESAGGAGSGYRLSAPPDRVESSVDVNRWVQDHISAMEFQPLSQDGAPTEQDRLVPDVAADRPLIDDTPSSEEVAAALFKTLIFAGAVYLEARQEEQRDNYDRDGGADPWGD